MGDKFLVFICVVVASTCVYFSYRVWTNGAVASDFSTLCLENHKYWRSSFTGKGFLGIQLDADGLPLTCTEE